ncbi:MAG: hypothetical protein JRI25_24650 [Deltaproteobacteria bacterium]|nr:hypothetical protein [Deltaproteobacteria bacterium]
MPASVAQCFAMADMVPARVSLRALTQQMDANQVAYADRLETLLGRLRQVTMGVAPGSAVHGRVKSPLSTWRKTRADGLDLEDLHDLVGLRVLVDRVSECYAVLDAVRLAWPGPNERHRDFIEVPKPNGYQSLHTTRKDADGFRFEIQIRTRKMHEAIERGAAAHRHYEVRRWQEAASAVAA